MCEYMAYKIDDSFKEKNRELHLENTYNLCVQELSLQQSKRDQTIAFYIAVLSFVIPAIINMEMSDLGKASGFILLYIFGVMMLKVIMRYRIYKEVYWNTCKTIAQLYDIKSEKINKQLVQHIFFRTLEKNASSVIIFKDKKSQKVDFLKSYRRVQNSAETTLYNILVFMSSIALWIGIYIGCNRVLGDHFLGKIVISTALVSLNYFSWKCFYYYKLKEVYGVVIDRKDKSFNLTYGKAWFLHGFYE